MRERRDFLPVCNDQGTPLVDFQAMFCVRCVQPECSRSRAGGLFEERVSTWQERLFRNPPRMSKDDPLYAAISAKRFLEIGTGRVPEVGGNSEWVDPRALEQPAPEAARPRAAKQPKAPQVEIPSEATPSASRTPREPLNSSFSQGTMLGDGAVPPPRKPADPWAAPVPAAAPASPPERPAVPVVKPGATIRFT